MITADKAKEATEDTIIKTQQILDAVILEIENSIHKGSYYAHVEIKISEFEETNYTKTFDKIQRIVQNAQGILQKNGYKCTRYILADSHEFLIKIAIHWD